jgi:hypothetical protein
MGADVCERDGAKRGCRVAKTEGLGPRDIEADFE